MALRRDYSLTMDIDFDKSRDIYALSNEYESVNVPGRNSKRVMKYLLKIYKGFSGNGKEIGRIYDAYNSYSSMRVTDFDYMFVSEAALLKDMYVLLGDYDSELESVNDRLGRMIDTWLAAINPKVMNPEQKQKDVQYAAQVELMLNRRIFLHETQDFIEQLTKGCLDETDYPAEDPDPDSPYVSLEVPIMTHVPEEADISVDDLFSSELSQVLYNIVAQDSYVIMKMFHDYENGNVCVRLWKKENDGYVPQFFSVDKTNVYLEKIGFLDQRAIWPGLIEAAFKQLDCDGDKLFLAEAILGPEYVKYKPEYLLGPNEAPVEGNFEEFNSLVDTYIKCAFDKQSSLTKDIDFEKNEDIVYSLYDKCEVSYIQGQYYKEMIKEYVTLYKGICGKGEDIDKLFNLLSQYASITVTDPDYTFVDEADNLRDAYFSLTEYNKVIDKVNEELSRMIDGWLASVNPKAITSQQRQQELRLIGQSEQILNRRFFVYESLLLLNALTQGSLTEGYPEEEKNPDSAYGFINLPMMTHIPLIDDLDGAELAYNPLTQVLYNMVALNSYIPTYMCHDYDNGNVCVRLWRREQDGYVPFYTSVDKSEIYVNKIGYAKQKTIWPGIIEAAFDDFGFPESKEEIVEAILGPDTSKYDMEYLCGGNNRPVENWTKELTETIRSYRKCLYDIYSSFLLTNSFVEEDELPYAKLQYAVKECMDIISNCLGQTLQQAQGAMQALSDLIEEYRESVVSRASSATVKKRLSVCDTAETLLKLFNSDSAFHLQPHLYFEVFLAERIAKIIISSGKKELTREEINKKKKLILTDSVFRQEVSKMNIHILANANDKMAESVLAKMERRS